MRRPHRYCLIRCQPKMSIALKNCYNLFKFRPLDIKILNISHIEWRCKSLIKLHCLGDVPTRHFMKIFRQERNDIFAAVEAFEMRIDNILFRCHFAESIYQARRLASSRMVMVNGKIAKPGTYLSVGDFISIRNEHWSDVFKSAKNPFHKLWGFLPNYLDVNYMSCSAVLIKRPQFEEIPTPFPRFMVEAAGNFFTRRS